MSVHEPLSRCTFITCAAYGFPYTCHGSHYKLFAVPVVKKEAEGGSAQFEPKVPASKLLTRVVSSQTAAGTSEALPFVVETYQAESLPQNLSFDGRWMQRAFKQKTYYTVVLAAFTKTEVCSII